MIFTIISFFFFILFLSSVPSFLQASFLLIRNELLHAAPKVLAFKTFARRITTNAYVWSYRMPRAVSAMPRYGNWFSKVPKVEDYSFESNYSSFVTLRNYGLKYAGYFQMKKRQKYYDTWIRKKTKKFSSFFSLNHDLVIVFFGISEGHQD